MIIVNYGSGSFHRLAVLWCPRGPDNSLDNFAAARFIQNQNFNKMLRLYYFIVITTQLLSCSYALVPASPKLPVRTLPQLQMTTQKSFENQLAQTLQSGTNAFPFFVLSFSVMGSRYPHLLRWFSPFVTPALSLTMLSMGMTLTVEDFKRVALEPKYVLLGFLAQYTIMPLAAYQITRIAQLGPALSAGLILVGCAPGGTASNLVTLIAQADVALSVVMTAFSTMAAVFMTPWLTSRLAGSYVAIRSTDLVLSTLQVVLAPVALGLLINTKFPRTSSAVSKWTPFASVLFVSLICGTISAANAGTALAVPGIKLLASIAALHVTGFTLGYFLSKLLGADEPKARTISIETGMQNSALASVLAVHFPNPQLTALPGCISATCHSLIGSFLAAFWRWRSSRNSDASSKSA